jgi:hypothetical protein
MRRYAKRLLIMIALALPVSLAVMTTVWGLTPQDEASWLDRLIEIALFLSVGGTLAAIVISVTHTWLSRRGSVRTRRGSILLAGSLGALLGIVLALSQPSPIALISFGLWGVVLGVAYGLLVFWLDPEPAIVHH